MGTSAEREARLRSLFEQYASRVLAYAVRQVDAAAAQDVVGDVYLLAWRRIDEVPDPALAWLLVAARNTIHNRRRSTARQQRLAAQLGALERSLAPANGADDIALERRSMLAALLQLSSTEREALLLTAWDGLTIADAAVVAGCSRHGFEMRLHRARSELRRLLDPDPPARPAVQPRLIQEMPL